MKNISRLYPALKILIKLFDNFSFSIFSQVLTMELKIYSFFLLIKYVTCVVVSVFPGAPLVPTEILEVGKQTITVGIVGESNIARNKKPVSSTLSK